jgi:hypothetical protein
MQLYLTMHHATTYLKTVKRREEAKIIVAPQQRMASLSRNQKFSKLLK